MAESPPEYTVRDYSAVDKQIEEGSQLARFERDCERRLNSIILLSNISIQVLSIG